MVSSSSTLTFVKKKRKKNAVVNRRSEIAAELGRLLEGLRRM